MPRTSNRGRNNNPTGRNQYSSDWMSTVKERPMTAAAVAAASVGAGVFLWSKRNQISEQLSNLSDQISEWTESMRSGDLEEEFDTGGAATGSTSSRTSRSTGSRSTSTRSKSSSGMSETGGGNASLGAHTGSGSGAIS
jgi:hypothetical protein